jgi:hypothetical protein
VAVVIFGAVALGVDLGHQTATRRSLQNISDAASLAAARDVCASPPCTVSGPGSLALAQQQAANDAAASLALNQGWPPLWIALNPANTCAASGYCFAATYAGETVAFSTPPATPAANCTVVTACAEVDLASTVNNGFATIIGQPHSVIRSTSIGFHANVNTKFGYALFSNTDVNTGNSPELINGNVYIGSNFSPQSNGQSYLCAEAVTGNANEPGYVVFGAPQSSPPAVNYGTCSTVKGNISSAAPAGQCPAGISWVPPPTGGANGICLANPALQPPSFNPPTPTAPLPSCTISSQPSVTGGVYAVTSALCPPQGNQANLTILLSPSFPALSCTSFLLSSDVTVSISLDKGTTGNPLTAPFISAYGTAGCNGSTIDGDQAAFYQAATPVPSAQPVLTVTGNGCCPPLTITGTIVLPAGQVSLSTNSALTVTGQAIVSEWVDQSGDHPNAAFNYNASDADNVPEQLRLVQ